MQEQLAASCWWKQLAFPNSRKALSQNPGKKTTHPFTWLEKAGKVKNRGFSMAFQWFFPFLLVSRCSRCAQVQTLLPPGSDFEGLLVKLQRWLGPLASAETGEATGNDLASSRFLAKHGHGLKRKPLLGAQFWFTFPWAGFWAFPFAVVEIRNRFQFQLSRI